MSTTDWNEQELGDILVLKYGWSLPEKKRVPGDAPVYGSNGIVGTHQRAFVSSPGLIVGRKGSAGNVHYSRKPFCPIDTTFYIAPSDTSLDIEFLYFLLLHIDLKRILGDVGVPGLNREMAYKEKVEFPATKAEQQKIAGVLRAVQRAVEQQERLVALTTELKKALLHKLFTQGLRGESQKQTEIGPVSQSWEIKRFDDFTTLQRGKDLTKTAFRHGTIPVAGSNGVIGFHDTFNVAGPGVTVGRSGSVGRVIYYPSDFWAHNTSLFVRNFHGNNPRFAAYYLEHQRLDRFRSGASVPTLDRNQFKDMLIAVPKHDEQAEIARVLETVDHKKTGHESKDTALTDLFRTLLHQLMTTQIRVHNLDLDGILSQVVRENGDKRPPGFQPPLVK